MMTVRIVVMLGIIGGEVAIGRYCCVDLGLHICGGAAEEVSQISGFLKFYKIWRGRCEPWSAWLAYASSVLLKNSLDQHVQKNADATLLLPRFTFRCMFHALPATSP